MEAAEIDRLVKSITDEIEARLKKPVRLERDQVCTDCTGTCARRCAFKLDDFLGAGVARLSGAPGLGKTPKGTAGLIDHTLLKADATAPEIDRLVAEAAEHGFASVCVNPAWVARCAQRLGGTPVKTCTVIGFPLGANRPATKHTEARIAQEEGATELDMVLAVGLLKSGQDDRVLEDIAAVVDARRAGSLVKVILETCLLTDEEKKRACRLAVKAGADYVKTSTGFSTGGATVQDIALMRAEVGPSLGVKASGGVKDLRTLEEMVKAGATRIGASAGVKIVKESQA